MYATNAHLSPRTVPLNINSAVHPHLGPSVEINIPTYYLAERLISEIHIEDGVLDSCNFMHGGSRVLRKFGFSSNYHLIGIFVASSSRCYRK